LSAGDDLVLLATLSTTDAAALLEELEARGIAAEALTDHDARARLAGTGRALSRGGLHVFVPASDLGNAVAVHQELVLDSLPDLPEGYDPNAHDGSACPACGSALDPSAHACADCGLEFPESER
jgi:hypothetical protein